jgi:predicted dehydrogenase
MTSVRIGIAGLGNMGKFHADYLQKGKVSRCSLAAVSDPKAAAMARYPQAKAFADWDAMVRSGEIDALLVATPHFSHPTIGIAALDAGLHLMVEKPIAVHKRDAEKLIAASKARPDRVFAAMFQQRTDSRYLKIKQLVENGELGRLARTSWIVTDWYRTEAYYASGGWRATWRGEGGGVLLNQCPHNLDLWQWICGRPVRTRAFCQLGRYHDIEVEDNVTAYVEYDNGATGTFVTSTGEAPGSNRFEIVGERGKMILEHGKIQFTRNEVSMLDFNRSAKTGFAKPDVWNVEIPGSAAGGEHPIVMQNFVNAILDGEKLISPAEEGLWSVELANAMLYSSLTGQTVDLPLNGEAYEAKLQELIASSRRQKVVVRNEAEDFTKSFNR